MSNAADLQASSNELVARLKALDAAVERDAILMATARAVLRVAADISGVPAGSTLVDVAFTAIRLAAKA